MSAIVDITDLESASSGSVVRMLPADPGAQPFYADFDLLTIAADALAMRAPLHLSGASGTGKSHFLNSLLYGPRANIESVVRRLDLRPWPAIKVHRLFVSSFETPSEVWYRTEVVNFTTEDRPQRILEILAEAAAEPETLHVVWLVESGRGIAAAVQGAFLEIIGQDVIREPRGGVFTANNISFVTDSNHAANDSGEFAIWALDHAYGRRWTRRVSFTGLTPAQETIVLDQLAPAATEAQVRQVVSLAQAIRQRQSDGALQSILPPTIDAELDLLGTMSRVPVATRSLVFSTLLGHCAARDREDADTVFADAFGVRVKTDSPAGEAVGVL